GQQKNTTGVLGLVKRAVHEGVGELEKRVPGFSMKDFDAGEVEKILSDLPVGVRRAVVGGHLNRDITREGLSMFRRGRVDEKQLGDFLNRQQEILRDDLNISTERIDSLISAALGAGALGCKINGSGGGGCMVAYGAGAPGEVIEAVERAGGTARRVVIDKGIESI
ncbi:MAG: GHMP kinase, partial [bacterium]